MPEQEQQPKKKKLRILCQIIKWIFIVLLGLMLIAGIYFQAPWKVLTLLAIILAALTILPKPARKYFWAGVGVVVIALVVWVFLPDEDGDWRPYTFDKELAGLEAARAVPDSENAAIVYNKLLADYDSEEFYPEFWNDELDDLTDEPWSGKDHPELAQWLKQHESTIKVLMQACEKEKCRFSVEASYLKLGKQSERLGPIKNWARLLIWAGNNDLGEGRIDQGLEKFTCALQMANHLYQQPTLIDLLVGISIEALATRQFNRFIVTIDAAEEHLTIIEEALAGIKLDWSSDLPAILDCEKLQMKNFCGIFYEVNSESKTRISHDPMAGVRAELPEEILPLTYWQRKLTKAGAILGWFIMPSTPQKGGEIIDASYERFYAMAEPDFDWEKEPRESELSLWSAKLNYRYLIESTANMMEEAYYGIHDIYLRAISKQRASQLLIALRRYKNEHGCWPESLDEVKDLAPPEIFVDAINGDSFAYKLTEENFTLYSKGKNNIDEGGEYKGNWPEEAEPDDRLIWP